MLSGLFFLLSLVALLAIAYALIGLVKPNIPLVRTRRRAVLFAFLGFVGFLASASAGQALMTPEQRRQMEERQEARRVEREAERAQAAREAAQALKPGERLVSQQDHGDQWPFTVADGALSCVDEGLKSGVRISSVLFRAGSTVYGLNGTAKDKGYPAPVPILKTQSLAAVKPVARLSEDARRRIFASIVRCEDANPDNRAASQSCKGEIQKAEALSTEEMKTIGYEGAAASWPPLEPSYMNVQPLIKQGLSLCANN